MSKDHKGWEKQITRWSSGDNVADWAFYTCCILFAIMCIVYALELIE